MTANCIRTALVMPLVCSRLVFHRTAHLGRHGLDVVAGEVLLLGCPQSLLLYRGVVYTLNPKILYFEGVMV